MPASADSSFAHPSLDVARIRAITLDLDDTLWPVWPTIAHAEESLRAWLETHAPRTAVLARDRAASHDARQSVLQAQPHIAHDLGAQRLGLIAHLLERAGDDAALAQPAFEVFYAARQRVTLYDDARTALERLAARYPLVAVSNGNADIDRIGLKPPFRGAVSARDAGVMKPDARIFQLAAQACGVPPHQVLHVGDDLELDVQGALQAGMQAAWVNRADPSASVGAAGASHASVRDLLVLCDMLGLP